MIYFENLPLELGIMIINYLDIKSKINVYKFCKDLRKYFAPCHAKKIVLSRTTVATVKILDYEFFKDFGQYIQELNLSGTPDLTANALKLHIAALLHLKSLDVTFTNIYLPDLVEICPENLKNISIHFFKHPRMIKEETTMEKCKSIFIEKQFLKVHFVVFEFLDAHTPLLFLKGVPLIEDLCITVADNYIDNCWDIIDEGMQYDDSLNTLNTEINFKKVSFLFRDCSVTHKTSKYLRGVSNLDFKQIEYIFIMYLERIVIYVSPVFKSIFSVNCSDLRVEVSPGLPLDFMLDGNIIFKAWNKAITNFNEDFFMNVLDEIKNYIPIYVCMHNNIKMKVINAASDWFCIDRCEGFEKLLEDLPKNVTLTNFCRIDGVAMRRRRPITLTPESKTLKNISFLRLSNVCLRKDFFIVLFSECSRLITLDIYVEKRNRSGKFRSLLLLSKSLHLAKKLQNIKVTSENIDYDILFEALSRCDTLENIHVCEFERTLSDDDINFHNITRVIEKCENLYSLFIEADLLPESLTLLLSPLKETAQKLEKDHLYVDVCDYYSGWNPFADVFNPSPLHILD